MAWKHDEGMDDSGVGGIGIWVWGRVDVEGGPLEVKFGDERGRGSNSQVPRLSFWWWARTGWRFAFSAL
jgi:hypothetical protein